MDYEKQIDRIKECSSLIEIGKITVLTGKNGSGKSLLRKLIASHLAEKLGTDPSHTVASVSMESRTNKKTDFSAFNALGIDDPSNPTSSESLYNIDSLRKSIDEEKVSTYRYLVIDEPEIGMGEEMVAALVIKLNNMFNPLPKGCHGVLLITHNRYMVKNMSGEFINMEGMSREEWLNREIIPVDIKQFEDDSLGLYRAINKRIEDNKKKK